MSELRGMGVPLAFGPRPMVDRLRNVAGLLQAAGVHRLSLRNGGRKAPLRAELRSDTPADVDLAEIGPGVLHPDDEQANAATAIVLAGDPLVLASPTYKATYSGLLKAFLDRLGTGALGGKSAVPILLGGADNHRLAVDLHFTPLLHELGARVPARGLFVLETDVPSFADAAAAWAEANAGALAEPALR